MTDQLSGGVVQPTDAQIAHWCYMHPQDAARELQTLRRAALAVPQAPPQAEPVPVVASEPVQMTPMTFDDGRKGWYIDHPDFYCDIEPDADGKWSVFFRDQAGREGWANQATPQAEPAVAGDAWALAQRAAEACHKAFPQAIGARQIENHIYYVLRDAVSRVAQAEPAVAEQAREINETTAMQGDRWVSSADIERMVGELVPRATGEAFQPTKMLDGYRAIAAALASQSTPPVAAEQAREAFDAWCRKEGGSRFTLWDLWQAALASQSTPPPTAPVASPEPVAWTLTETLKEAQTTTCGYLWFNNPRNSNWTPLYAAPIAPSPPTPPPESAGQGLSDAVHELIGHIADVLDDAAFEKIDTGKWNAVSSRVAILAANPTAKPDGGLPLPVMTWAMPLSPPPAD